MNANRLAPLTGALLLTAAAAATLATAAPSADSPEAALDVRQERPAVVLVHGAWGGGWDWRPMERMLTDRGYDVYRVTLTGLGERVHLGGPDVDLSTHIADVVNTILFEDLRDVVLLGHSYGGMVITGVADSIPDRLEALVYLDAFVPRSGETVADIAPGLTSEDDVLVPSWVDPEDPYPRDVPHPAGTLREPLELDGPPGAGVRAAYILTREPGQERDAFQWAADRAAALGWPVHELEADHNPQRSARDELVGLIEEIARGGAGGTGAGTGASIYHDGWIDFNKNGRLDPYEDPALPVDERVEDLLGRMTLDEKTMQMVTLYGYGRVLEDPLPTDGWRGELWKDGLGNIDEQHNGVVETDYAYPHPTHVRALNDVQRWFVEETRLGIPVDFTNEGIRGLAHYQATSFPAQIAQASTWDVDLIGEIGRITGREARALGYTNIYSPILDLARDPRWGRTVETYGEDPFLVATLGAAAVRGLQSERVVSTPKHFAVYGVPEGGRDGDARTAPHVTTRDMHEIHLRPFRDAFAAGALGTMSSYNDWNGLPVTGSRYFLTDLLRGEYGFEGYVVSDSRAVENLVDKHRVAPDAKEAVYQSVDAGLNVRTDFSPPAVFVLPLRELVREGRIGEATLDSRVRDVLRVKFRLGLFDQPYVADPEASTRVVRSAEALETSLRAARESLVLLKNEAGALPLDRARVRSILVTGPMAAATEYAESRYGPNHLDVTSVLDGLLAHAGDRIVVDYEEGVAETSDGWPESELFAEDPPDSVRAGIERAVRRARDVDVVVAVLGGGNAVVGESRSRTSLDLPGHQLELLRAVHATGTPVVLVLINGRPLTVNWADRHVAAILEAWFPSEASGRVVAEALFGDINPGGKLPITFPRTVGQIPLAFPHKRASQAPEAEWIGVRTRVNGPLYPFGHGLSYTTFEYRDLRIEPARQDGRGTVAVSFDVTNTGARSGDAVPQLYVRDDVASVTTWDRQLRGFDRIALEPGETRTVTMTLGPEDLWLLGRDMTWTVEAGMFEVMVGASSQDIRLSGSFEVTHDATFGRPPLEPSGHPLHTP